MLPVVQGLHLRCSRPLGSIHSGQADHDGAGSRKFFKIDSFHEAPLYIRPCHGDHCGLVPGWPSRESVDPGLWVPDSPF